MKESNARIVLKHDIEANWLKATNFIPMRGEMIIYDAEIGENGELLALPTGRTQRYDYARYKFGDGRTTVSNLPFANGTVPEKGVDYWTEEDKAEIKSYVDEAILNGEW